MEQAIEIFMLEDSPADLEMAKEVFEQGKILNNFSYAEDGEAALDYLNKRGQYQNAKTPDIIILDINVPRINGIQVLEEIKKDSQLKRIPVIMLTTSDALTDIEESYAKYANAYIQKPFQIKDFYNIVDTFEEFWFKIVKLPTRES